jgi:hypothetical protein
MTSRTIVCSECGEAVPYGRLSCPACGALLASVAGGSRAAGSIAELTPDAAIDAPLLGDDAPLALSPSGISRSAPREAAPPVAGGYVAPGAAIPPPTPRVPPPSVLTAVASPAPATPVPSARPGAATASGASSDVEDRSPWWAIDGLDVGIDRAIAIGAGLVVVGLMLPWSRVVIGGGQNLTSYFGTWGLAGPGHILVLVAGVAVAVLASVPSRVPAWLRSGVGGMALGVFVLGLLWPYVVGPLGASFGSLLDLIGAIVLVVAGVVATWRARHAGDAGAV